MKVLQKLAIGFITGVVFILASMQGKVYASAETSQVSQSSVADVGSAHIHTDDCYCGIRHICTGNETTGGGCFTVKKYHKHTQGGGVLVYGSALTDGARYSLPGGCYNTKENYSCSGCLTKTCGKVIYMASKANAAVVSSTKKTGTCAYCKKSTAVYQWKLTKTCSTCKVSRTVQTNSYYCSQDCVYNQHKTVTGDKCTNQIKYCPGTHVRYKLSCGKSTSTVVGYSKGCGKTSGAYYVGNTQVYPVCNQVVTQLVPAQSTQLIVYGKTPNLTATAHFLDGSSKSVQAAASYDKTLAGTQTAIFSYGLYNSTAKNKTPATSKIQLTTVKPEEVIASITPKLPSNIVSTDAKPVFTALITFLDGSNRTVSCTNNFVSGKEGTQKVTMSYGNYYMDSILVKGSIKTTYTIEVVNPSQVVTSIKPNQTMQTIASGKYPDVRATITYLDGTVERNQVCSYSGFTVNKSGKQVVTLSYGKYNSSVISKGAMTTTIQVTVVKSGDDDQGVNNGAVGKLKKPVVTITSGTNKVTLNWKKQNAKEYVVYRSTKQNGKYTVIATTNKVTYTDKKMKKGVTYYYKVKAKSKTNSSFDSSYSNPLKCIVPKKAVMIKVSKKGTMATLKWKKETCSGYIIYRSTNQSKGYTTVATIKNSKTITYKDQSISSGKTYYYKIKPYYMIKTNSKGNYIYGSISKVYKAK